MSDDEAWTQNAEALVPALKAALWDQMGNDIPDRYVEWINVESLAVEVALSVAIPARKFVDDMGRRWEWCGGIEGAWAWRVTAAPVGLVPTAEPEEGK